MIQTGPKNHKTKKKPITIRSLNENKIITKFHIDFNDAKFNNDHNMDFLEYHHGFLYVKYNEQGLLKIYDV